MGNHPGSRENGFSFHEMSMVNLNPFSTLPVLSVKEASTAVTDCWMSSAD